MTVTKVSNNLIIKSKLRLKKIILKLIGDRNEYKLQYFASYLKSFYPKPTENTVSEPYDLVFVATEDNKGWILGAICQEIAKYFPGTSHFSYANYFPGKNVFSHYPNKLNLPPAKAYFFAHYSYFAVCLRLFPDL